MNIFSRTAASMRSLWPWSRPKLPPPDNSPEVVEGWIRIYSGGELLRRPEMIPLVEKITANFRGTPTQQYHILNRPLHAFASLVQLLPASEYYHHFERGGLLRHQLECMAMAMTAQYQIHQLVDSRLVRDNIPQDFEFWTNYCFQLRALTHDIGKLQTLFNIYLLVARGNNRYEEIPYDPMDGGFGTCSLFARAEQEKEKGALWVRYRYTFKRGATLQQHQKYWDVGVAQILRFLSEPIPGKHYSMHLTDSESFRTYLLPKLEEIDRRSVVNYHTRADRAASPEQILYRQVLEELSVHPQLRSAELVQAHDGRQIIFLPFSVLQAFLIELPQTDLFSTVPRHPDQCFKRLKGAGYTTHLPLSSDASTHLAQYNGRSGLFLNADISSAMLGASFLRRCSENVSARIGELMDALTTEAHPPPPVVTPGADVSASPQNAAQPSSPPVANIQRATQQPQSLGAAPPVSHPPRLPSPQQDAETALLLGSSAPRTPSPRSPEPTIPAGPTSPPAPVREITLKPPRSPDSPSALPYAMAQLLESMSPEEFDASPDVELKDDSLFFNAKFTHSLLKRLGQSTQLSDRHFQYWAQNSAIHCPEKWTVLDGQMLCTPEYSRQLRGQPPGQATSADSSEVEAPPISPEMPFQALLQIDGLSPADLDRQPPATTEVLNPAPHLGVPPSTQQTPARQAKPPPAGRDGELLALLDSVRAIYIETGDRLLETDGRRARLDFRAVDHHTGDKQRRGRVLEMLRHLRLYVEHKKNSAILIHASHPEIQACLADLQKKR